MMIIIIIIIIMMKSIKTKTWNIGVFVNVIHLTRVVICYKWNLINSSYIKTFQPNVDAMKSKLNLKTLLSVQGLCASHPAHKTTPPAPKNIKYKWNVRANHKCCCWRKSMTKNPKSYIHPACNTQGSKQAVTDFISGLRSIDLSQASMTDLTDSPIL